MSIRLNYVLQQNSNFRIGVQFSSFDHEDPREKEEDFIEEEFELEEFEDFYWEEDEGYSEEDSEFDDYSGEEDF